MKKFLMTVLMLIITVPALAENTILIIGDSLSAGYGIDPEHGWVKLLEQRLKDSKYNYQVINDSISGDTLSGGLSRLPGDLTKYKPQITIIELGGNDGLRGLPLDVIQKNLTNMIMLVKNSGSKVLILGLRLPPNYGIAYTQQFQQVFQNLEQQDNMTVVPLFLKNIDDNPSLMQADGIHPKQSAQNMMVDNMWQGLETLLH